MKSIGKKIIYGIFKLPLFESLLRPLVSGSFVGSFRSKFVPPNFTYRNPTYRKARVNKLVLHGNLFDYNDWKAFWNLREVEREQLYRLAENSVNIVDVGVNNGWVLMNMARLVSAKGGFVYGFEPHPETYERCLRNIKSSGISNCKVFNMACGDKASEMEMITVKESNSGQNRIVSAHSDKSEHQRKMVRVERLDDQLKDAPKINLIKIDVEGFELFVLRGAYNLIGRDRPSLFIEIDDRLLRSNGSSAREVINFLGKDLKYKMRFASNGKEIEPDTELTSFHFDIICQNAN